MRVTVALSGSVGSQDGAPDVPHSVTDKFSAVITKQQQHVNAKINNARRSEGNGVGTKQAPPATTVQNAPSKAAVHLNNQHNIDYV